MGLSQFVNSIGGIISNRHVNSAWGIYKHLIWQVRKSFNIFPCELSISKSRILAKHNKCGISALINSRGMFDFNNMNLIKWLLKDGGVFFDIGANIGAYSLVASEQAIAQVFAFEPHPATFEMLTENIALNRRDNITPLNLALGNADGMTEFTDEYGSPINRAVTDELVCQNTIRVPLRRGKNVCREYRITPDFVKLDVEGFEYEVLKGFDEYLGLVKLMIIESNEPEDSDKTNLIFKLLSDNGLIGPYYFDISERTFHADRHKTREDAVFISIGYCDTLRRNGFRIELV